MWNNIDNSYELIANNSSSNNNNLSKSSSSSNRMRTGSASKIKYSQSTYDTSAAVAATATATASAQQTVKRTSSHINSKNDFARLAKKLDYDHLPGSMKSSLKSNNHEMKLINMQHTTHNIDLVNFAYVNKVSIQIETQHSFACHMLR